MLVSKGGKFRQYCMGFPNHGLLRPISKYAFSRDGVAFWFGGGHGVAAAKLSQCYDRCTFRFYSLCLSGKCFFINRLNAFVSRILSRLLSD